MITNMDEATDNIEELMDADETPDEAPAELEPETVEPDELEEQEAPDEPEAPEQEDPDADAAEAQEPEAAELAGAPPAPDEPSLLCALQCVLFVAGEPLPVDRIAEALEQEVTDIPRLCDRLNEHLEGQGLHVVQLAGGFALATRPEFADYVQRLLEPEPERLSIQALETLAIIAYRQPITKPEIDLLRGVNSGGVVSSLLEKGLIRIKGRKDAPGRPFLLEITAHFLSAFGLKDLSDLPKVDLPELGVDIDEPKVLGEALEELSTIAQEEEPSEA